MIRRRAICTYAATAALALTMVGAALPASPYNTQYANPAGSVPLPPKQGSKGAKHTQTSPTPTPTSTSPTSTSTSPTSTSPTSTSPTPTTAGVTTQPAATTQSGGPTLPFTGLQLGLVVALGLLLLLLGAVIRRLGRGREGS